jgi:hypothetical protein
VTRLLAPPPVSPPSASPPSMAQGTSGSVTLTGAVVNGSGFYDPGAGYPNHITATVNCTGVTVNSVTYNSPTSITLNLTIAPGAPTNNACTVTVTNPDGQMVTSAAIFGCGKANGAMCGGAGECLSNFCVGGVCCNSACGSCGTCSTGSCTPVYGPDSCSPEVCSGTSPTCPTTCATDAGCAFGFWCSVTACVAANLANGVACTTSAQCLSGFCSGTCTNGWDWATQAVSGDVSPSLNLNGFGYLFTDSTVKKIDLSTGAVSASYLAGGSIENFPEVAPLADGQTYVFFTASDGYLYKVNTATMALATRRQLATAPDTLQATPALQIAAYSSTNFTTAWAGHDLVYVLTRHATDTVGNQLIAVDAADLSTKWSFTGTVAQPMDYGSEGCYLDYATDLLYCGTHQPAAQSTLWAFDTTKATGNLSWSINAGSLHNRPQLASGVLYVADMSATLRAIDPASHTQKWSRVISASPGAYVANNLWAEFRLGPTQVFVTDSTGALTDVVDNGGSSTVKWTRTFAGAHAMSPASVAPTPMLAFVGLDDGTVHELDLAAGADVKTRLILHANSATPGNIVVEPTFAVEGAATDINKVITSSAGNFGTNTKQIAVPLP